VYNTHRESRHEPFIYHNLSILLFIYSIHYTAWRWKLVSSPLSKERHVPLWRETRDAAPGFGATALTLLPVGPSGTEFTRHRRFSLLPFSVFSLLPFSFLLLARGVGDRGRLRRRKPAARPPSGRRPAGAGPRRFPCSASLLSVLTVSPRSVRFSHLGLRRSVRFFSHFCADARVAGVCIPYVFLWWATSGGCRTFRDSRLVGFA